jgi:hypothetical protein
MEMLTDFVEHLFGGTGFLPSCLSLSNPSERTKDDRQQCAPAGEISTALGRKLNEWSGVEL